MYARGTAPIPEICLISGTSDPRHFQPLEYLSAICSQFLSHPEVVEAFTPVYLGEYSGSKPTLSTDQVTHFKREWSDFLEQLAAIEFPEFADPRIFGVTRLRDRPDCRIFINVQLLEGFMDKDRERSNLYLLFILTTFVHEIGHAFSYWTRNYRTPLKLRVVGYPSEELKQTQLDQEWEVIRYYEPNATDADRGDFIGADRRMGESGYVVERGVFGGVPIAVMSRLPQAIAGRSTSSEAQPATTEDVATSCPSSVTARPPSSSTMPSAQAGVGAIRPPSESEPQAEANASSLSRAIARLQIEDHGSKQIQVHVATTSEADGFDLRRIEMACLDLDDEDKDGSHHLFDNLMKIRSTYLEDLRGLVKQRRPLSYITAPTTYFDICMIDPKRYIRSRGACHEGTPLHKPQPVMQVARSPVQMFAVGRKCGGHGGYPRIPSVWRNSGKETATGKDVESATATATASSPAI